MSDYEKALWYVAAAYVVFVAAAAVVLIGIARTS